MKMVMISILTLKSHLKQPSTKIMLDALKFERFQTKVRFLVGRLALQMQAMGSKITAFDLW